MTPFELIDNELGAKSLFHMAEDLDIDTKIVITGLRNLLQSFNDQQSADLVFIGACFFGVYSALHTDFARHDSIPDEDFTLTIIACYRALIRNNLVESLTDGLPFHVQEWLVVQNNLYNN